MRALWELWKLPARGIYEHLFKSPSTSIGWVELYLRPLAYLQDHPSYSACSLFPPMKGATRNNRAIPHELARKGGHSAWKASDPGAISTCSAATSLPKLQGT